LFRRSYMYTVTYLHVSPKHKLNSGAGRNFRCGQSINTAMTTSSQILAKRDMRRASHKEWESYQTRTWIEQLGYNQVRSKAYIA
jgi:hypothetical protein